MLSLRNRFGIPAAISVIALVFAMVGGAYAADNSGDNATTSAKKNNKKKRGQAGLNGKQKRQVIALAKRFAGNGPMGPQGVPGVPGIPGVQGIPGAPGAKGDKGDTGDQGPQGVAGEDGEDGATGPAGPEGSPWTEMGTLPSGETLTGAWSVSGASAGGQVMAGTFSFPLPLESSLANSKVHLVLSGGTAPAGCTGGTAADPKADQGHLCIYEGHTENATDLGTATGGGIAPIGRADTNSSGSVGTTGGKLLYAASAGGAFAHGTFAVTAP